jgi:hypothetical protein
MKRCDDIQSKLIDFLDDRLDALNRQEVVMHLETCEKCRLEESGLRELLRVASETPDELPGVRLRNNFNRLLQSEMKLHATEANLQPTDSAAKWLPKKMPSAGWNSPAWRIAAALILLLTGIGIGTRLSQRDGATPTQMAELKNEVRDVKQTLMMSMLKQESASDRIKAVDYSEEIVNPNQQVLSALITTLNHDKNVNVRLASLYSLSRFSSNRTVLDSLVVSLNQQTEPIIQIVMINILTQNKEPRAIKPLEDIISNQNTLPAVKDVARKGLQSL